MSYRIQSRLLTTWSPCGRESRHHRFLVCSSHVLLLLSAWGCDSDGPQRRPTHPTSRVVVLAENREDSLWPILQHIAETTRSRAQTVDLVLEAPSLASPSAQQELLRKLTSPPPDILCIVPTEVDALRARIDALAQGGLPVILIGRDFSETRRTAYCGPMDYEIGQAAARAAAAIASRRSRTVILVHAGDTDPLYNRRYLGFVNELPQFRDMTLLRELDCGRTRGDALTLIRNESRKYPRVGCWVLLGDWPLRALPDSERLLGPEDEVVLCHVGRKYLSRLRQTHLAALITADVVRSAEQAISLALQWTRPDSVPAQTINTVPAEIITLENMQEYEHRCFATTQPAH